MKPEDYGGVVTSLEIERRREIMERHLVDGNVGRDGAFCGADASDDELMGVDYYLEMRKDGFGVGTVCEGCKVPAPRFAMKLAHDLEAQDLGGDAEDYRQLAQTLLKETGRKSLYGGFSCFRTFGRARCRTPAIRPCECSKYLDSNGVFVLAVGRRRSQLDV